MPLLLLDNLGSAQTRQGFALDPPPFEKGGPKLYCQGSSAPSGMRAEPMSLGAK